MTTLNLTDEEEQHRFDAWQANLPMLELTLEEQEALTEARKDKGQVMTVEEIMAEAKAV